MAESQAVAKQALKKLEDQLTCAICLDAFKDPKLLQCFHVYCKDCLQRLVVQDRQGQLSLRCPTCRQSTLLPPATGMSGLQPAFHIHHLFEIQDALEKVKAPKKVLCTKCNKNRPATSYCRDCGKYICASCTAVHSDWDDFAAHEVVALQQLESKVKQLDSLKKVTLYCSLHNGKELELYCETCEELICHNCTVKKHCRPEHKYDLVDDTFEKHKAEMVASLDPVENLLGVVIKALEHMEQRSADINDQRVTTKAEIQKIVQQLHEILEARKTELCGKVDEYADQKVKNLAAQKDEVETVHTQLVSCLSFVRESLRTGSQGEVMKVKKTVMKQIKEMTDNFKPDKLVPCEAANLVFVPSPKLAEAYQQFGEVFTRKVSPEKCYATGKGIKLAEVGERTTAVVHIVDDKERPCAELVETMCELVSANADKKTKCTIKTVEASKYEISYQPTSRGRHQLHIKVEGKHIKGSPFTVIVKLLLEKLGTPVRIISGLNGPRGVAVNQRGEVIVTEQTGHCISIFSPTGEKLRSFGSQGSGQGQFINPRGVAVDDDGNILVVDNGNNRIQKFTSDGKLVRVVGRGTIDLNNPIGISIHPDNKRIIVSDHSNSRIQSLNPDLTFHSSFGGHGDNDGQTANPWDVAFDSAGNIYQGGNTSTCVQVFNTEGQFLRRIGQKGSGKGELNFPSAIAIDSEDVVYVTEYYNNRVSVFTSEGAFLTSFGTKGNGQGQFEYPLGITIDENGFVYVSDYHNGRIQIF